MMRTSKTHNFSVMYNGGSVLAAEVVRREGWEVGYGFVRVMEFE